VYHRILVALDHTKADDALLPHVGTLAQLTGAEMLLVHVADGWVARNYDTLNLAESEEMREDRDYLDRIAEDVRQRWQLRVTTRLALGDPPREILRLATEEHCDLIAMTTHGHRLIGDILFGSTIEYVRHRSRTPLLIVNAAGGAPARGGSKETQSHQRL
jgi:nucleotide-binding universal stress UspA family protein